MTTQLEYPRAALEHLNVGNMEAAVQTLHGLVTANEGDIASLHLLGVLSLQAQRYDIAADYLKRAISRDCKAPPVFFHYAQAVEGLGFSHEANAAFRRAIELDPSALEPRIFLYKALQKQERYQEALHEIRETVARHPQHRESWNELERTFHLFEHKTEKEIFPHFGPLLFVGQGHSAGAYVASELARRLGLREDPMGLTAGSSYEDLIIQDRLERFLASDRVLHTHLYPSKENLMMLQCSGIKKLVVHVRDPRQSAYSITHWYEELKKRSLNPADGKYNFSLVKLTLPENYYDLPFEKKLDFQIERQLNYLVNWQTGWLDASVDPKYSFKIMVTRFEDLKTKGEPFFHSLLDFYGIDRKHFKGEAYQCGIL